MDGEELPPGWAWATLGEVLPLEYGAALPGRSRADGGVIPVYGSAGVVGNHDAALVAGPTIIVGRKGSAGAVFYSKGDCWPIDTAYFVRAKGAVDLQYGYHFLKFCQLAKLDQSTAIPSLSRPVYSALGMPVPPRAEQTRIATAVNALFEELDEAEAALARAREGVEQFRASLLHAACTGQLTAAWRRDKPPAETGADLLRRILAERRTTWERAERARLEARGTMPRGDAWKARYAEPVAPDLTDLPDLPEGWVWASVDQLTDFRGNGLSRAPDGDDSDPEILRISAVRSMMVNITARRNYRPLPNEKLDGGTALDGDLLFTRYSGSEHFVGVCGLYPAHARIRKSVGSMILKLSVTSSQ